MLYDYGGRLFHQISQDIEGIIGICYIRLARVLTRLQQLRHAREILTALEHFHIAQDEISALKFVKRRLLTRIFAVPQTLFFTCDIPCHLLVEEGFPFFAIDKRNFHLRCEVVCFNSLVSLLEVFHIIQPFCRTATNYTKSFYPRQP